MKLDLCQAAELAYQTLLDAGITYFTVDVEALISRLPFVKLMSYQQASRLLEMDPEELTWVFPSQDAFTLRGLKKGNRRFIICYQEKIPLPRRRFSLAHELGHVLLEHEYDGSTQNQQVNCFAQHLLCPRPLLQRMAQVISPLPQDWACQVFGLSPAALRLILCSAPPQGIDARLEKKLAQQLNQPLDLPPHCRPLPALDPSVYLSVL
ncbi:MAG: ImmA/IrrE family metallo-endopeptidase [Clostridia bacterium]|nr:ImmA/IrrE family metallo-endopeptidase [Clostridia bacterium]